MAEKDQQNPFTIGNPFTIQLEDTDAEETTEQETVEVEDDKETVKDDAEVEVSSNDSTEEQSEEEEVEQTSEETKEIEIEDILDKPVEFDEEEAKSQEKVSKALETEDAFFDYEATMNQLIKDGFWEDFEGRENLDIDADTFKQLAKQQDKWKKDNIAGAFYSSLDPAEQEYLEFKKMGGNLDTYYKSKSKVNRASNLNIDTNEGRVSAIYSYYKNFVGWDDAKIQKFINKLDESDFREEAENSLSKVQEHLNQQHQQMMQKQKKIAEQRDNAIKSYKSNVRQVLKEQKVSDSKARQIVKSLTDVSTQTGFTEIDKAYVAFRNDPAKSVLLYNFLTDPESFINSVSESKQQEERKKLFFELKKKGGANEKKDFSFKPTRDKQTRNPFTNK